MRLNGNEKGIKKPEEQKSEMRCIIYTTKTCENDKN